MTEHHTRRITGLSCRHARARSPSGAVNRSPRAQRAPLRWSDRAAAIPTLLSDRADRTIAVSGRVLLDAEWLSRPAPGLASGAGRRSTSRLLHGPVSGSASLQPATDQHPSASYMMRQDRLPCKRIPAPVKCCRRSAPAGRWTTGFYDSPVPRPTDATSFPPCHTPTYPRCEETLALPPLPSRIPACPLPRHPPDDGPQRARAPQPAPSTSDRR